MLPLLTAAAVAHSTGYHQYCNVAGPTEPPGFPGDIDGGLAVVLLCDHLNCTLTASEPIRGFVISSKSAPLAAADGAVRQGYSPSCLTHVDNSLKTSVRFAAAGPTTLWATAVAAKAGNHRYNVAGPVAARPPVKRVLVVGAGPGGLAAARYAAKLGHNVTVYERGDHPPSDFYDRPIQATTYQSLSAQRHLFYRPMGENTSIELVQMVGGNQAVNGAVYAPGTPAELAGSVGVTVAAAARAQQEVATYVHHVNATVEGAAARPAGLMQECRPNMTCDHTQLAFAGVSVHRRSIGYQLPANITVRVNSTATAVSDEVLRFADQPPVQVNDGDVVIVAAGALTSPQLLGQTTVCGHNHYWTMNSTEFNFTGTPLTQHFQYFTPEYEHNIARYGAGVMNISMQMQTAHIRECHTVGGGTTRDPGANGDDSWHYMGTIKHTMFLAPKMSRVFVGDASALLTPFNCHTSMPAAAAGVLAMQAALGTLEVPQVPATKPEPRGHFMGLFIGGVIVLAVGVVCHTQKRWKDLHYVLMPLGVSLIIAGVVLAANDDTSSLPSSHSYHKVAGYVIMAGLIAQSGVGTYVWITEKQGEPTGMWHRAFGYLLLVVLAALVGHAAVKDGPTASYSGGDRYRVGGWVAVAVTTAAVLWGAWRLRRTAAEENSLDALLM